MSNSEFRVTMLEEKSGRGTHFFQEVLLISRSSASSEKATFEVNIYINYI